MSGPVRVGGKPPSERPNRLETVRVGGRAKQALLGRATAPRHATRPRGAGAWTVDLSSDQWLTDNQARITCGFVTVDEMISEFTKLSAETRYVTRPRRWHRADVERFRDTRLPSVRAVAPGVTIETTPAEVVVRVLTDRDRSADDGAGR